MSAQTPSVCECGRSVIDTEKEPLSAEMHVRVFDKDSRMGSEFMSNLVGRVNVSACPTGNF